MSSASEIVVEVADDPITSDAAASIKCLDGDISILVVDRDIDLAIGDKMDAVNRLPGSEDNFALLVILLFEVVSDLLYRVIL